ncbi:MAG TPA: WD40 repeat domain-containing protein [Saprospiraceae bacterium]|nr:WD40 repeat domain-containing protein [Saprospiraceae bacterium]
MEWSVQKKLNGHKGAIYKLIYDPGRQKILSTGGDGYIVAWDPEFSTDGQLLARDSDHILTMASGINGEIYAGTLQGNLLQIDEKVHLARKISHHTKGIYSIITINHGLISAGADGRVTFWDSDTLLPAESLQLSQKNIRNLAIEAEENILIAGAGDGNISIIDLHNRTVSHQIVSAHKKTVFSLAFTHDRKFLISGGMDAQIRIWEVMTWKCIQSIPAHWYTVNDISVHPMHPVFASASRDRSIKIWDSQNFQLLKVLDRCRYDAHSHSVNTLLWSEDGQHLYSGSDDRSIRVWEVHF